MDSMDNHEERYLTGARRQMEELLSETDDPLKRRSVYETYAKLLTQRMRTIQEHIDAGYNAIEELKRCVITLAKEKNRINKIKGGEHV
jgi:hypothetical protein